MHLWGHRARREGELLILDGRLAGIAWMLAGLMLLIGLLGPLALIAGYIIHDGASNLRPDQGFLIVLGMMAFGLGGLYLVIHRVPVSRCLRISARTGVVEITVHFLRGLKNQTLQSAPPWTLEPIWIKGGESSSHLHLKLRSQSWESVWLTDGEVPQFSIGSKRLLADVQEFVDFANKSAAFARR